MPKRPPRPCTHPGCPEKVQVNGLCPAHAAAAGRAYRAHRALYDPNVDLYNNSAWRKRRDAQLRHNPLCTTCMKSSLVVAANEVDHIIPVRLGGSFTDSSNLQSLCKPCHSRKTVLEVGFA